MKKYLTVVIIMILSINSIMAQKLTTQNATYDFGQILFRTPATAVFKIKNTSHKQIKIKEIYAPCGCTKAKISKKNIASNKEGTVEVVFDAKQLGHFHKEILLFEEGEKEPFVLTIKGVVATEIKDYSKNYPYEIGQIRTDKREIEFDDVYQGKNPTQIINILNTTGETIEPVIMHLPKYLKAEISPTRIAPEQGGEIRIMLISDAIRDYGLTQTSIFLGKFPGEKVSSEKEIPTSVILLPSVSQNTTQQQTPQITLSDSIININAMTGKANKLKSEITIQNTGKTTLEISSLQMFTAGMQISLGKSKLAPTETTKLKIQIDSEELKKQKSRPRILMITNDPKKPKVMIEIR